MNYENIDNFKLNRFDLFFHLLFSRSNPFYGVRAQGMGIQTVVTILAGILFIVGTLVFSKVQEEISTTTSAVVVNGTTTITGSLLPFQNMVPLMILGGAILITLFTIRPFKGNYTEIESDEEEDKYDDETAERVETRIKAEFNAEQPEVLGNEHYDSAKQGFWGKFKREK